MTRRANTAAAIACAFALTIAASATLARSAGGEQHAKPDSAAAADRHTASAPDALKWTPASPGISAAVLHGSPQTEGSTFVLRLRIAAGTRVPPHWHPVDEHLTVMSGTFYMGAGERFDEATATALTAGTYTMMPKEVRHFGWTGSETIVQIHGVGPFKTYLVEQPAK